MGKYRIMAFDGGGIRGALTAALLKRFANCLPNFLGKTNLFAGTSTGSLIALSLAYGLSPKILVQMYSEIIAQFIFMPENRGLVRPKYGNRHLKEVLQSVFPSSMRLNDLQQKVLIPSFKLSGQTADNWEPVFFNNFPNSSTGKEYVIDVALASTAAPVYFPSYQNYIDGGVIANNPSLAAISLAVDQQAGKQKLEDIVLLSLGTGTVPRNITANTASWGAFQWALSRSAPFPLLNILSDGVVEANNHYCSQLLGQKYFRLNPLLPKAVSLDDYKKIPNLVSCANSFDINPVLGWLKEYWYSQRHIGQVSRSKVDLPIKI